MATDNLKQTPLYDCHKEAGAKFIGFSGWDMPLQYTSLKEEHQLVRESCGLFDVSHMGEAEVTGPGAFDFLQAITSNDLAKISPGKAQYTLMLNEAGGVVDDIIIYMLSSDNFFICLNAGNAEKDIDWLKKQIENFSDCEVSDLSSQFAQIAIQGPQSESVLSKTLDAELAEMSFFSVRETHLPEYGRLLIARTGYTGEDGFEVFLSPEKAADFWQALVDAGAKPAGFGARDTLRLEACLPLHGHELRDDLLANWSNVRWAIKYEKGQFIGKEPLLAEKNAGLSKKLVGFKVTGKGIVRADMKLFSTDKEVGWVTSGTMTPTLGYALGLAYVDNSEAEVGKKLMAEVRSSRVEIELVKIPFYKKTK